MTIFILVLHWTDEKYESVPAKYAVCRITFILSYTLVTYDNVSKLLRKINSTYTFFEASKWSTLTLKDGFNKRSKWFMQQVQASISLL